MTEQFQEIQTMLTEMVTGMLEGLIQYTPNLIGGLAVLIVGWLLSRVVKALIVRAVSGWLDSLLEKTGITVAIEQAAVTTTPSAIVGRLVFWLVMLTFIMAASRILGLDAVSHAITSIMAYIPTVVSAAIILAAGVFAARFVGTLVTSGAAAADLSYASGLGAAARMSLIIMVGVVTLDQLGVDTQILVTVITVTVAALVAGVALAFALGAREVVGGILAGHYLRQRLPAGQTIEVDGHSGSVEAVGPVSTLIRGREGARSVPNSTLLGQVVEISDESTP